MNYEKIYEDFIGKEKIQPLEIRAKGESSWVLKYREGKFVREVECGNREELDKILIEFGGKNPETCKTEGRFLSLTGEWTSKDISILGHTITKISLDGQRKTRQKTIPFALPKGTGYQCSIQSKRGATDDITLKMNDTERVGITRSFKSKEEFDAFQEYVLSHQSLKELSWYVRLIGTESRDTKSQCVWKRVQAGDGTKRMVLELRELDGKSFQSCVRADLFNSAGDMFDAPCKRITIRKTTPGKKDICQFHNEDGKRDLSGYEASN